MIEIHTSDRNMFRRCRRKWDFGSPLRRNLSTPSSLPNPNLWLGTGIHFALQDYNGYNHFKCPITAFEAYCNAFRSDERPEGYEELVELGMGMLEYYLKWLEVPGRAKYETLWIDGVPQVEIEWRLDLTEAHPNAAEFIERGQKIVYHGTFDRVVRDRDGRLWVEDYKTTRTMDFHRLALDSQMKAYSWAAEQVYHQEFAGALMLQMVKSVPQRPKPLKTGGFSKNKQQKTTHWLYREALMEAYGKVPPSYVDLLNTLAMEETEEGDKFIHLGKMEHNIHVKFNTYNSIVSEMIEMLSPTTPLYPNPNMQCSWDCQFRTVCIVMDEGGDWKDLLYNNYTERSVDNRWKERIEWPNKKKEAGLEEMLN